MLAFGANAGAVSAYWGIDEKKFGYWAHGLGLSLAILPVIFFTGAWFGFILRSIVLTLGITLWSEYTHWDILEEWGRGFIMVASVWLLTLGG